MSISPEIDVDGFEFDENSPPEPSATFRYDFKTNRITSEIIDGIEAIEQFIYLTLRTRRFIHPVYPDEIGEEVHECVENPENTIAFKKSEIPRLIEEALIYDDRIERVYEFSITEKEDSLYVSFEVDTVEGYLSIQEVY
ncbi:DUF2634 domain-containing protein [Sporosarcina sp. P17b]|uniref:DUF2634 domain-containing protein n=1 Tax=Sporosarcina sp. P17b TaxID=2048260 RepID=UPI000C162AC1|nr:DUF2634 domain-containing protein [Sporosarcina sp. P17b]PIC72538.1 phage portal protein [Sporosarcina sp. P17b]